MRVLLDECVPARIRFELAGHDVETVGSLGWKGKKNGALPKLAEVRFDVLVTVDRNLSYQQKLRGFDIAVISLIAETNEIEVLRPLLPRLRQLLRRVKPGQFVRINA